MVLGLAAALLATAACPQPHVYSSQPLHGSAAAQGRDLVAAERLAVEEAGSPVRYVALDDSTAAAGKWDADKTAANARRAARDRCALAYLGEYNSGASEVSAPLLNRAGLAQITPANSAEQLTRSGTPDPGAPEKYFPTGRRTFGRVVPIERVQAAAQVEAMRRRGVTSLYVVDDGSVDGRTIGPQVVRDAQAAGIAIAGTDSVDPATADVDALAARVAASGATALFFAGFTQSLVIPLWRQLDAVAPALLLFADDGVADEAFAAAIGDGAGARTTTTAVPLAPRAYPRAARRFFARFRARYHRAPQSYAIYGYEAARFALDLIARGGPKRSAVVRALFATRNRRSVLGTYSIDRYGDTTLRDYGVYRVENGREVFDFVATPSPAT